MTGLCACGSLLRPLRCCAMDLATASPAGSAAMLAPQIQAAEDARLAGDAARATAILLEVLELAPWSPAALSVLARVHQAAGRLGAASVLLGRVIAVDPANQGAIREAARVADWIGEAGGVVRKTGLATLEPTVLRDVAETARVFADEAFGPVVSVNRYTELDEVIGRVNASVFGLQASIFTRDLAAAFRAARRVHVGGFLINDVPQFRVDQMPYGGVKQSGTGREGPRYAMEEMTERKLICWPVS